MVLRALFLDFASPTVVTGRSWPSCNKQVTIFVSKLGIIR